MKRIIRLTESDLTRIVRRVIKEQESVSDVSTIGGVTIPGFLFAEDDSKWIELKNKETNGKITQEMFSNENAQRVYRYYGAEPTSANPDNILNKYMIAFNATPKNSNIYLNSKENVYQKTFLIGKVATFENTKFTYIGPSEGFTGFHVRVPPVTSGTRGKGRFLLNNGDSITSYGSNGVFNRVADYLDKIPYAQLDVKFKITK